MFNLPSIFPIHDPTWIMACVLLLILGAPLLFERIKVPPLVGMVVSGVLVGPYGLGLLERDASFEIFGQVGLYYIMFTAGLSMDISAIKNHTVQVTSFGVISFGVAFLMGFAAGRWLLSMPVEAAVLVACILSSHTMVAFSIVSSYGLAHHRSVTLSVVATMISLVASLFVLAMLSGRSVDGADGATGYSGLVLGAMVALKFVLFVALMAWGLPRVIRYVFQRLSDDVLQYIFVMFTMLLCAAISATMGLEGVMGAFVVGLVMNRYIPESAPLMNHIDFMGNALFIPYFLIGIGMLIDVRLLVYNLEGLWLMVVIVLVALFSKCAGAWITARLFRLDGNSLLMMCGLTSAHAAGALAIVMVGRRLVLPDGTLLVDDALLNAVVMLILFSCIFSAYLTSSASRRISLNEVSFEEQSGVEDKMLVALSRPETMPDILTTAILMRPHRSTTPLVGVRMVLDAVGNEREINIARTMVNEAATVAASAGISMKKVVRSSVNPITGLTHMMKDFETSEIIMGYNMVSSHDGEIKRQNSDAEGEILADGDKVVHTSRPFAGELIDAIPRQIIMVYNSQPINTIRKIHVVVPLKAEKEIGFVRWLNHVLRLARQLDCRICFYCCDKAWELINERRRKHYAKVKASHALLEDYGELTSLKQKVNEDHLLVLVAARSGAVSFHPLMHKLSNIVENHFQSSSLMLIYPDQYGVENRNAAFTTGFKVRE